MVKVRYRISVKNEGSGWVNGNRYKDRVGVRFMVEVKHSVKFKVKLV